MPTRVNTSARFGLNHPEIRNLQNIYWNLSPTALIEQAVRGREGLLSDNGALIVRTGTHTGRSPNDKFFVTGSFSEKNIWWGPINRPFETERYENLYQRILSYLQGKNIFIQDCFVGADPKFQLPVRVITEDAWHSLFARQLFIQPDPAKTTVHSPEFTIINVPRFKAIPEMDGTRSDAFIIINLEKRMVLIGGTGYAGEIKKAMFTVMNYLLPQQNVMSMHASANVGQDGNSAVFFGLSGTGKTSLSADPTRSLIGDDEIAWSDDGLFNLEGGCYAKCIRLSAKDEPMIHGAIRFGTVLENVGFDSKNRTVNYDEDAITENTRACYPLSYVENALIPSRATHPKNVVFLTCDAFGVLPPISKLTHEQAMYHFLSGYSAKIAGTEAGVKEPQATFSACFGAPFMALRPEVYGKLLREKIERGEADCWLINTGWTGGPYGTGNRIKIGFTRAMVRAALDGSLSNAEMSIDPVFGLAVPKSCPEVPDELLHPRNTWPDKDAYDRKAQELKVLFEKNFAQFGNSDLALSENGGTV